MQSMPSSTINELEAGATNKQQTKKKMMMKNWDEIHANEYFKESKVRSKTRQGLNPPLLHSPLPISELRSRPFPGP